MSADQTQAAQGATNLSDPAQRFAVESAEAGARDHVENLDTGKELLRAHEKEVLALLREGGMPFLHALLLTNSMRACLTVRGLAQILTQHCAAVCAAAADGTVLKSLTDPQVFALGNAIELIATHAAGDVEDFARRAQA